MYTELNQDNLAQVIAENEIVQVQFSAGWCGNCRIMKPKFKRLANDYEASAFVMVDAEKFPESRKLANVNNLPTCATFINGELVGQTQTNKADLLKSFINETSSN